MCLGIPGRVVETFEENQMPMGKVDFGGVAKRVCLCHTPKVEIGEYVIVHVGFALQVIDEDEAKKVFEYLREIDELHELHEGADTPPTDASPSPSTRARPADSTG